MADISDSENTESLVFNMSDSSSISSVIVPPHDINSSRQISPESTYIGSISPVTVRSINSVSTKHSTENTDPSEPLITLPPIACNGNAPPGNNENAASNSDRGEEVSMPYTIFTSREKSSIILLASLAGIFSPLSSNIYFPTLPSMAADYKISAALANLTITFYMIFQGLAPSFTSSFSDGIGRRPVYIACFSLYLVANIALALQHDYATLLVLRCLQSSGSSGISTLANTVVADLSQPHERGRYMSFASMGGAFGITLGPIIGGALSNKMGWRFNFWFLVIAAGVTFLVILVILPETGRAVVHNGRQAPPPWSRCLWDRLPSIRQRRVDYEQTHLPQSEFPEKAKARLVNPLATLRILADKETGLILLANGIVYAGYCGLMADLSSELRNLYGYNDAIIGLCYLPAGVGGIISTLTIGKAVDWNFRRISLNLGFTPKEARDLASKKTTRVKTHMESGATTATTGDYGTINTPNDQECGITVTADTASNTDTTPNSLFPIEKARLQVVLPLLLVSVISLVAYGWVFRLSLHPAAPLAMVFLQGYTANGIYTILTVLIVDTYPESPGTASAANNLVRCWLGAATSILIVPMVSGTGGAGWAYTLLALLYAVIVAPLLGVVMKWGKKWREDKISEERVESALLERRVLL